MTEYEIDEAMQQIDFEEKMLELTERFPHFFDLARCEFEQCTESYLEENFIIADRRENMFSQYVYHAYAKLMAKCNRQEFELLTEVELAFVRWQLFMILASATSVHSENVDEEGNEIGLLLDITTLHDFSDLIKIRSRAQWENYFRWEKCLPGERESDWQVVEEERIEERNRAFDGYDEQLGNYFKVRLGYLGSESETIKEICSKDTPEAKIEAIDRHIGLIDEFKQGRFWYGEQVIDIEAVKNKLVECWKAEPQWCNRLSDDEVIASLDPVTYNYALILFHKYRLCPNGDNEWKAIEALYHCIVTNMHGRDFKEECWDYIIKWQDEDILKSHIKSLTACYNNVFAYFYHYRNFLGTVKLESQVGGERVDDDFFRSMRRDNEKINVSAGLYKEIEKVQGLLSVASDEESADLQLRLNQLYWQCDNNDLAVEAKEAVEILARTMDMLYLLMELIKIKRFKNTKPEHVQAMDFLWSKVSELKQQLYNVLYVNPFLVDLYKAEHLNMEQLQFKEQSAVVSRVEEMYLEQALANDELFEKLSAANVEIMNHKMELMRSENRILAIREYQRRCMEALKDEDLQAIVEQRQKLIADAGMLASEDVEYLEEMSECISDFLKEKIVAYPDYNACRANLEKELGTKNFKKLPEEALKTLTTAEYLYEAYIHNKENKKGFDYSCISALYYQSLESAYNKMVYSGYVRKIRNANLEQGIFNGTVTGYFPAGSALKQYFSGRRCKDSCMYGNFISLLEMVNRGDAQVGEFGTHLVQAFGKQWQTAKMNRFVQAMESARNRRNDASHGGKVIDYDVAKSDKQRVLCTEDMRDANLDLMKQWLGFFA